MAERDASGPLYQKLGVVPLHVLISKQARDGLRLVSAITGMKHAFLAERELIHLRDRYLPNLTVEEQTRFHADALTLDDLRAIRARYIAAINSEESK
jgi:hypothetical protein